MKTVYILNGPNLNLLGTREPEVYGKTTLAQIEQSCRDFGSKHGLEIQFLQSNHEGQLIDWIQDAGRKSHGILINPGAYTHTSIALRDAVAAIALPVIEVHISNIFAREGFRRRSHIAPVAKASLCGFGIHGYALAIEGLARLAQTKEPTA